MGSFPAQFYQRDRGDRGDALVGATMARKIVASALDLVGLRRQSVYNDRYCPWNLCVSQIPGDPHGEKVRKVFGEIVPLDIQALNLRGYRNRQG